MAISHLRFLAISTGITVALGLVHSHFRPEPAPVTASAMLGMPIASNLPMPKVPGNALMLPARHLGQLPAESALARELTARMDALPVSEPTYSLAPADAAEAAEPPADQS